jgi:pimeloyl-ACP methyl ester carboxylesterase
MSQAGYHGVEMRSRIFSLKNRHRSIYWKILLPGLMLPVGGCRKSGPPIIESPGPGQTCVYLMMGFGDRSWSGGLDSLATKLRKEGCCAQVVPYREWKSIMQTIVRDRSKKVVLIGHSHGGVQAIKGAVRILEDQGLSVRLLVLLDVGRPDPIPANVDMAVHYYVDPPTMSFRKGPRSKLEPGNTHTKLTNIAVGPEGDVPAARDVDHLNISNSDAIHRMIIREMSAAGLLGK